MITFDPTKQVRLRIAGIYFDDVFDYVDLKNVQTRITGKPGQAPTILELLEVAAERYKGISAVNDKIAFEYGIERRTHSLGLSLISFSIRHTADIKFTIGGNERKAGTYRLAEFEIPGGVVAWQYYVIRNQVAVSQYQPPVFPTSAYSPAEVDVKSAFVSFDQKELQPGDQIIWRQVAILREPNAPDTKVL